jgi:hypothetical protein
MGRKPLRQARLAESPIPARCFSDSGRNRGELREMRDDPPGPPIPPLTAPRRGVQARSRPHSGRLNQMPKGNAGVAHSRTGGVLAAEGCAPPVMEIWSQGLARSVRACGSERQPLLGGILRFNSGPCPTYCRNACQRSKTTAPANVAEMVINAFAAIRSPFVILYLLRDLRRALKGVVLDQFTLGRDFHQRGIVKRMNYSSPNTKLSEPLGWPYQGQELPGIGLGRAAFCTLGVRPICEKSNSDLRSRSVPRARSGSGCLRFDLR